MTTTRTITHLTHSSGLKLEAAIAYQIQHEGVSAIPQELLDKATPAQAEALLHLAGYAKSHPLKAEVTELRKPPEGTGVIDGKDTY